MRILFMAHAYPPRHGAGAEWHAHSLFRALDHQVDVLLSTPQDDGWEIDGIRVHPWTHRSDPFRFLPDTDIIVTHLENTARATILGNLKGIPVVHLLHNTFPKSKTWLAKAQLGVFNSDWMAADFGPQLTRTVIVRPPVYAQDYQTAPGSKVTLVNLNDAKGGPVLWALAERMPDVEFLAVAGGYGPQIIRDLPNVEVVPNTPDMRSVYGKTRLLLMPSAYESWGRVGVEAMCSGIPVIATPTPGLRESLGAAGTFVDREDLDGWEQAIRRLLKAPEWKRASSRASARAIELDPTADLARWRDAIDNLGRRHGRKTAA